ncbi:MAG: efflux RND transporter permease subunit [Pseudomonadales bacterium]
MNLVELATRRPVTVFMATAAVLMFGFISLDRLGVNLLPELAYPTLTIRTEYEGAAPAEVEELITRRIEERVGVVTNVRKLLSVSAAGQSDVVLEFNWGMDMDLAAMEVREKLDLVQLPLDVRRPRILRLNPNLDPIVRLGLSLVDARAAQAGGPLDEEAERAGLQEIRRFSEEFIKRQLDPVAGVAAVRVSGGFEDEIHVLVDENRLAQYGLTVQFIANRLKTTNVNLAGGRLADGTQDYLVRTVNEYANVDEIRETIIRQEGGRIVRLADLAEVELGHKERESITRIDGRESVEIAVYKEGDANTVAVARAVQKKLSEITDQLPERYSVSTIYDQSRFIVEAIREVQLAAIQGGILAILVLYFFLRNLWATLIISLSIPISVMATFALMHMNGITLNVMSLGGIALAIGLLVDNSIVVLENIASHREQGLEPDEAARRGTSEVGAAITASTLTTIAVFLPLVFVEGIAGQLFRDQALTVTFALLASLLVAFTLIPMLSSRRGLHTIFTAPSGERSETGRPQWQRVLLFPVRLMFELIPRVALTLALTAAHHIARGLRVLAPILTIFERAYDALFVGYGVLLRGSLKHPSATASVAVVAFAIAAWQVPRLGMELIPSLAQGEFRGDLTFSPGTALQDTDRVLCAAQLEALSLDEVVRTYSVAGTGGKMDASAVVGGENIGELNVVIRPDAGPHGELAALERLRSYFADVADADIKFSRPRLFTLTTPLEVEIESFDQLELKAFSDALLARMEASPTFSDVKSTMASGYPEIQIFFDADRAARLGLVTPDIANTVVRKVRGEVATDYSWRDKKIDVRVRVAESDRDSVADIGDLIVNPESDHPVTLSSVADIAIDLGPAEIHRIGQQRVARLSANVGSGDLREAAQEVRAMLDEMPHPGNLSTRVTGQNEEMEASFTSLQFALALAVFMVYLVLASLFESFLHPLIIIFSVPLAFIGAVLALSVTATTLSVVVFIGLILLAGIVVNNAIVLLDRINQIRAQGAAKLDAIIQAAEQRFRPIVMTTLTTILGLLPMAIGIGGGGEIRAPMAITVIGGLSVSTLLTLVLIPVVYNLVDHKALRPEDDRHATPGQATPGQEIDAR